MPMKIGSLLEKLIDASKRTKTDFALSMNMTPSGLSKILTGGRLPSFKERRSFTEKAATYFAEAIYSHGCYLKLAELFPFSYDFRTQDELRGFLLSAIEYALDLDLAADNSLNLAYSDRNFYYLGRRSALNNLCVLLSDCVLQPGDKPMEVYFSSPLFSHPFFPMLEQVKFSKPELLQNISVNYIIDPATASLSGGEGGASFLSYLVKAQRYFNLDLWRSERPIGQSFLLVKGKMLLILNDQLDGTPLLLPVLHKNYLSLFYHALFNYGLKRISYSRAEAAAFLEKCPNFLKKLIRRGIDAVYNFTSIGYLLTKDELTHIGSSPALGGMIWELFNSVLSQKTTFTVSVAAMERFGSTGQAVTPVLGAFQFAEHERMNYMARFDSYLKDESSYKKVKIIDSKLSNLAILVSGPLCIIYTTDDSCIRDRIHIFRRDAVLSLIEKEIMHSQIRPMDLSDELWSSYRGDMSIR